MKIRSIQTALTPCKGYACLACRLRFPPTKLHGRRQQHADTESSNSQSETIPVQFPITSSKGSTKENGDVSDGGKSNDAPSSLPNVAKVAGVFKIPSNRPLRPSPEAQKLQQSLHEKFLAQRRKDAIALQLSDDNPGESTTLSSKKLLEKEAKRAIRKKVGEVRRAKKKALALQPTQQPSPGSKQTPPPSETEHASRGPISALPDTEKRARKARKNALAKTSSDNKPSIKLEHTETTDDAVSTAAQPGSEQDLETESPAKGSSLLQEPSSQEPSKPPRKIRGRRSTKVKKASESPRTKQKISKGDVLSITRYPSKGQAMPLFRKTFPALEASLMCEQGHPAASTETVAKDRTVKPRIRGRAAGAEPKLATPIENLDASELKISALDIAQPPVPHLSYGLERVLFNPGVYHLQDPRSRVYNFDPYLQTIMPVAEFNFDALKEYITSSRDTTLQELAASYDKRYVGSSSSMTGILAHFHFLLSQWRPINTDMLSREFPEQRSSKFTEIERNPSAIFLRWRNGSYAIDADKEFAGANVLMLLGKSMEKLLTLETQDFEKYRKSSSGEISTEEKNAPESYHYSTMGDFIMRSQLDAHDPRLPGTGMFDLKTRAVVSVRMDASHFEEGAGYQIKTRHGAWESFEREYFDMIRSAFLKYSLQVRMGRMDGIFVAFHNTERIFGFQYISLSEMDSALHGQWDTCLGDQEFKLSIALLNDVLNKATKKYPDTVSRIFVNMFMVSVVNSAQSLRLHFETRMTQTPFMYIFAEPVTEEQIITIQTANDAKIQEFEQRICGKAGDAVEQEDQGWENLQANVQDAMEEDLRDPNHDEGRQDLDPVLTSTKQDGAQQHASSNDSSTIGPSNCSATAAADDDEDVDDDSDGDEEVDEDDDEEEDGDEDDEEEEDDGEDEVDSDEVEPEGVLIDNAAGQGTESYADAVGDVEKQCIQGYGDEATSSMDVKNQEALDMGAVEETGGRGEDIDTTKAVRPEESDTTSDTTSRSEGGSVMSDPDQEKSATEAEVDRSDGDSCVDSQKKEAGDELPTGADVSFIEGISQSSDASARPEGQEIMALTLTIRNKVNQNYVVRPEDLGAKDQWTMEYSLDEVSNPDRAWSLYQACQLRRRKKLDSLNGRGDSDDEVDFYIKRLRQMSREGAEWRKKQDEKDKASPVKVLREPIDQKDVDAC
ncbi:MAG: hypothetical protein Q9221_000097 [Calogaya cf. arnoldii]